jgi:hypothetical protein
MASKGVASMSIERWSLAVAVILLAGLQYGLTVYAVRDLLRRPSVRGNNKVAWGLLILGIPFIGSLLYTYMGPTSFIPRHRTVGERTPRPTVGDRRQATGDRESSVVSR